MELIWHSPEVAYSHHPIVKLGESAIEELVAKAFSNPSGKARICCHRGPEDYLHDMIIAHTKTASVRCHKHSGRVESLFAIRGEAMVFIYNDQGEVEERFLLAADNSSIKKFEGINHYYFYRLNQSVYHNLEVLSDVFVFHEATTGPFQTESTLWR